MFRHLVSVDSTNAEARRIIAEGSGSHASVVLADEQTRGYGRRSRTWLSPRGNLHFSLIVEPSLPQEEWGRYSILSAVILNRVLASVLDKTRLQFKWPNDILVDGCKICGMLIEPVHDRNQVFLIIGVGLNVLHSPYDSDFPATNLAACGVTGLTPETLLQRFMAEFDVNWQTLQLEGIDVLVSHVAKRFYALNERVHLSLASGHKALEGICRGMDSHGFLLLEDERGIQHSYSSGNVSRLRTA